MRSPFLPGALISMFAFGALAGPAWAIDLSRYRDFQLGTDLSVVARQANVDPSEAKLLHARPALIQELEWRPQVLGSTSRSDPQEVTFTFYDGRLFRVVVDYDSYQTEGMTDEDMLAAFLAHYGISEELSSPAQQTLGVYGDREQIVARWQDARYRFELSRSSYGPTFKLVGVLKTVEAQVDAALLEAKRLDDQEAPQREAARLAAEAAAAKVKAAKARLINKPKFQP